MGEFDEAEIPSMLAEGKIDLGSYYWREGMADWMPISELEAPIATKEEGSSKTQAVQKRDKNKPTKTQASFLEMRGVNVEGLSKQEASALVDDLKKREKEALELEDQRRKTESEQPSKSDLALLDYFSVHYSKNIKTVDARKLVENVYKKHSTNKWNLTKHLIRPDLFGYVSYESRIKQLHEDLQEAQERYLTLKKENCSDESALQYALDEIEDAKYEIETAEDSLNESAEEWNETFLDKESCELHIDKNIIPLLKAFKKPSKTQIKAILKEFRDVYHYPEELISFSQFFFVYKKLYPDSLKKGARVQFGFKDIVVPKTHKEALIAEKGGATQNKSHGYLLILIIIVLLVTFCSVHK